MKAASALHAATPDTGAARAGRRVVPGSTYRLQMRPDFTFADAQALLPYFRQLGITHLYLSPILLAHPGSTHGYDLTDHNVINPELGGEAGFAALADAIRTQGGGVVIDFVPNHMGVDDARLNPWWWDVLENGMSSPFSRYFDIDWDPVKPELRGKVLLPVLGDQYGRVLERGELSLAFDRGGLVVRYFERTFPVNPRYGPMVYRHDLEHLERSLGPEHPDLLEFLSILTALDNLPSRLDTDPDRIVERQREKEVSRDRMARLLERSTEVARHVATCVRHFNGDVARPESFKSLHALLEEQAYRLAYWRTAFHEINYRRFFDVNALASLRMEAPEVFETAHELLLQLVAEGRVTGVRLDHVDGLYDPHAYLTRLTAALAAARAAGDATAGDAGGAGGATSGDEPPAYVVVEKILSPGETLPPWPVHGTTGYDYLNELNGLFVDPQARRALQRIYRRFTGRLEPFEDVVYASKKVVMESTLASEVNLLAHALNRISEDDPRSRDFTLLSLRDMLVEVIACFPVYRAYVSGEGWSDDDRRMFETAVADARRRNPAMDESSFAFLLDVLFERDADGRSMEERARRRAFTMSLQQYTGPVQAKGLEDTAFFRHHLLLSLNEVGGAPQRFARAPESFHAMNLERLARWPHAMSTTATHDTKRGEDMRARLDVLSQMAEDWGRSLSRWARVNAPNRTQVGGHWAPDRNDEYFIYQTMLGAWPTGADTPGDLTERLRHATLKAIREAKTHTSWINANGPYEQAVLAFADRCLTGRRAPAFLESFLPFQRRIARAGMVNSLAQVILKIASPGVPDIYQGAEFWDLSLVDPDNRRPVDFAQRRASLAALEPLMDHARPAAERAAGVAALLASWEDGRIKLLVTALALRLRAARPALFERGDYLPLAASGLQAEHVVAFARRLGPDTVIAVTPRLTAHLAAGAPPVGPEAWGATRLVLPADLAGRWVSVLTGETLEAAQAGPEAALPLARLFGSCPLALLHPAADPG